MKKFYIFCSIFFMLCVVISLLSNDRVRVFKIDSPDVVFVDFNKNFVFDEKSPLKVSNFYYVTYDSDFSKFPILKDLTDEEKVFLDYYSKQVVDKLLKYRFVKIRNNDIYINNRNYKDILLSNNVVFDDSELSQYNLYDFIKKINLDEYVIFNKKTKKYHKLSCEETKKYKDKKLLKISELPLNSSKCNKCHSLSKKIENHFKITQVKDEYSLENINIFFIDLNQIFKPSNKCDNTACRSLLNEIRNAKSSIDFAIYGINNQPYIIKELSEAKKRGVTVRFVTDSDKTQGNYYPDTFKLMNNINSYNTDKIYDEKNRQAIMHNKFFIFDKLKVWTGSSNITSTDLSGFNANYSVLINSQELAQIYTNEFEQMYSGLFHRDKNKINKHSVKINKNTNVVVAFSPQDDIVNKHIVPIIVKAEKYIYIPIFVITSKEVAKELINAKNRGVDVKVITDATNSHSKYSVHKLLRNEGIKVKTENYAGKLHTKAMIVDDKISVIGSMNFTKSGNENNDENVLIIFNEEIAQYLKNTFVFLWNKIPEKYEKIDPRAESFDSIGSCFDGIDNNFDGKIDKQDYGCMASN